MSSRDWAPYLAATALVLGLTAGGCGKKGPPLPPLRYVPAPTKDLAIIQRGTNVLLSFTYPKTTPAGIALNGVTAVEVWEMERQAPPPAPPPPPAATKPAAATTTPATKPAAGPTATTPAGSTAAGTTPPATTPSSSSAPAPANPTPTPTITATATAPPVLGAPVPATPSTPAPATPSTAAAGAAAKPAAVPGAIATPAVGAASVPPPAANLPGGFPAIDPRELEAKAKLLVKIQGADIAADTIGDKVVITLPLPQPLPVRGAPSPVPAAGTPGAAGSTAAGTVGTATTTAAKTDAKPSAKAETASGKTNAKPATTDAAKKTAATATSATTPAPAGELVHYFVVRTTGPKGDRSAFSNQAALIPFAPPAPPTEIKLAGKADGVEVSWTYPEQPAAAPPAAATAPSAAAATSASASSTAPPAKPVPERILGFNVYRRDATTKTFGAPVRAAPGEYRSTVDTTARFGESYIYSVTAITDPGPLRESAIQGEAEIKYVDRFPPPAPTEVVALAETGSVRIVWRASSAPDLGGYLVYRRQGAAGDFRKLTEQPITDLQYQDMSVARGATYTYRVTAVDKSGNESPPGEAQTKAQ